MDKNKILKQLERISIKLGADPKNRELLEARKLLLKKLKGKDHENRT